MARQTYVWRDGEFVPKHMARPLEPRGPRSGLPRPYVISDGIGGVQGLVNPSDGKYYTSKSKMRAENRARGLTEVGNESFPERPVQSEAELAREIAAEVAQAYDALEAGAAAPEAKSINSDLINTDAVRVPDVI